MTTANESGRGQSDAGTSGEPDLEEPLDGKELFVPEDDSIIARALVWSLAVALVLAVAVGITWWILSIEPEPEKLVEVVAAAPEQAQAVVPDPPLTSFKEVSRAWGIDFQHVDGAYGERLLPETMGSGVAVFDLEGDGDQDLLFVNSREWPWREQTAHPTAALFRNDAPGKFTDITAGSGLDVTFYGTGVAVGDYDGDGRRDLFIAAVGENRLFHALGDGRFEDVTAAAGVAGDADRWSASAMFFDHDRDGDLDLFVANYVAWSREIDLEVDYRLTGIGRAYGPPMNYAGTDCYLYRNDGEGRFTDVSAAAGIQVRNRATGLPMGKSLALTAVDVDADGWLDVVVANDTVQNFLFHNLGDGRFEEIGAESGVAFNNAGAATGAMGLDAAQYTGGDELAVAIGNFANEMTSFYVANGARALFTDEAIVSGVGPGSRQALSFGVCFLDVDLDGRLDLFQTNGHVEDEINRVQPSQHYRQPSQLFWNCGEESARAFVQVEAAAVGDLATPVAGRSAAYGDLDGDGDLDLVITQPGERPLVLRNDQSLGHHWLRVRLQGEPPNQDGFGARLELMTAGGRQQRVMLPARSYLASAEAVATFGLGNETTARSLEVRWPDGASTRVEGVAADQVLVVKKGS